MAVKFLVILLLCFVELFMVQTFRVESFKTFDYVDQDDEQFSDGPVFVQPAVPSEEDWLVEHQKYSVFCGKDAVKVVLPSGSLSEVKILGSSTLDPVLGTTKNCGYSLTKEQGNDVLHVSFSSCHVTVEEGKYILRLLMVSDMDPVEVVTVSCDLNTDMASQKIRVPRSGDQADCPLASMPAMTPNRKLPQNYTRGGCNIPTNQRMSCGPPETTAAECMNKGCCMDATTSFCYYPMDQCTADGQFVFTIYSNISTVPVNPTSLHVAAKTPCKPILSTDEFATFKFFVSECGTKTYTIGDTTVYMAEVRTAIKVLNLKYGVITRDHPIRVMVECRYSKISPTMMRASAGYMVVSPSVPSSVRSGGLFGVQLRIATDETFSSFSKNGHLPLNVLLGKPLYLEVRLNSPKPEATLLINYCVAYTRSGTNALVLLYEGCPNPDLSSGQSSFLRVLDVAQTPHERRFVVTAFQFMNVTTQKYINEEIYFMCSTEVCMPPTPCRKTCFDGKA